MTDVIEIGTNGNIVIENSSIQVVSVSPSTTIITQNNDDIVVVENVNIQVNTVNNQTVATIADNEIQVITIGIQGQPGTSVGDTVNAECGQAISALKVVYTNPATDTLFYADVNDTSNINSILGISTIGGNITDIIPVQVAGELSDSIWNWDMTQDVTLFLGANGNITQGFSMGAVIMRLGYALSPTTILIRIAPPIITA